MNVLELRKINRLACALEGVNVYANLSSRLGKYKEANNLYWLKDLVLKTFSKPEVIYLKQFNYNFKLYAIYSLGSYSFLLPLEPEEAEALSQYLPLKVDNYLGALGATVAPNDYKNLHHAIRIIRIFLRDIDISLKVEEEEALDYLLEASRGKTVEALKAEEAEEARKNLTV